MRMGFCSPLGIASHHHPTKSWTTNSGRFLTHSESPLRASCIMSLSCVFHRGRRLLTGSRTETTPLCRLAHNAGIHSSARGNHRTGHDGRRKFTAVGRKTTREVGIFNRLECFRFGFDSHARSLNPVDAVGFTGL
jgi:hypothetical protein